MDVVVVFKSVKLNVLDIYLDEENPRHDYINEQMEIIETLIANEQVKQLARDISINGISPLDVSGVIKDKRGRYIVVEGNRRICALKLLNDPKNAPLPHRAYFSKLAASNSSNFPKKIDCQLFGSREDANLWIERRHSGTQDGVGSKQWNSEQKTRFNVGRAKRDENALASSMLQFAESMGFLPEGRKERILTTASRYLGNPYFRSTLGILSGRSEPEIELNVSCEQFSAVVKEFCDDLLDPKSGVSSRTKKDDWIKYADHLISKGVAPTKKTAKYSLHDVIGGEDDSSNEKKNDESINSNSDNKAISSNFKLREKIHPDKRKYIIPHDFYVSIDNKILHRVFKEMKAIPIDEHTLSVSLLTRAFLENLYGLFHEQKLGYYMRGASTHTVMDKIIKYIEKDDSLTKQEIQALGALRRVQANKENVLSPNTLGANAHASHYPNSTELKREWDNIGLIIQYMLKQIE